MKTIVNVNTNEVIRIEDNLAASRVKTGVWVYCPKSRYTKPALSPQFADSPVGQTMAAMDPLDAFHAAIQPNDMGVAWVFGNSKNKKFLKSSISNVLAQNGENYRASVTTFSATENGKEKFFALAVIPAELGAVFKCELYSVKDEAARIGVTYNQLDSVKMLDRFNVRGIDNIASYLNSPECNSRMFGHVYFG